MYLDDKYWPTVEHYYQAMKTLKVEEQDHIRKSTTAAWAKRHGRDVQLRSDWENIKDQVMYKALWSKFENCELRSRLLATNNDILQEGNSWHDTYWGIDLETGQGQNKLGKMLMQIREKIDRNLTAKILLSWRW
jgi:ribA/ribD-fused uncharacterized protein